jgi:hypothetical protein
MDCLHVVRHPFTATPLFVGAKSRKFTPGEMLWFDDDDRSGIFKANGFNWRPDDPIQFTQSIYRYQGPDPAQED